MSNVEKTAEQDINALLVEKLFFHQYQPLFDLSNWSICGFEALFRCQSMSSPESIFQMAKNCGILYELDTSSISKAISRYVESKRTETLFVNIVPETLLNPFFPQFLEKLMTETSIAHSKVVFEMTETVVLQQNVEALYSVLSSLRENGFRIGFDQVGQGTTSIMKSMKIYPDYIKLDRYFSTDLSLSDSKQNVISTFLNEYKEKSQLILKGIEQPDDLAIAKLLGVSIGQGYLLGLPAQL